MKKILLSAALLLVVNHVHAPANLPFAYRSITQKLTRVIKDVLYGKLNEKKDIGFAEMQGRRNSMEDAHHIELKDNFAFFGLYDGHGGKDVADFAAQNLHDNIKIVDYTHITNLPILLHDAFVKTHGDLDFTSFNTQDQGCTALVACIHNNQLFVANAGDSRAVLCSAGKAIPLSTDHKPDRADEKKRIEALGGFVMNWGVPRVNGQLAVSRALGDKGLNPFVIPDPEITQRKLISADEFLILACDGVWDVMSNQTAVDTIKESLKKNKNDCKIAAQNLRDLAFESGSTDNISVIVINLNKFK